MQRLKWYEINDTTKVISPSLLVYPDRIKKNIQLMLKIAGGTEFLRPHIKTHKMAEIIQMQMKLGIYKFKCATIAEAELLADCGVKDILLAMQPVGPNISRFFSLMETYPNSKFSSLVDNANTLDAFIVTAKSKNTTIDLWVDIDNGMHRTGIPAGPMAETLYERMVGSTYINARGLHAYDGHIYQSDFDERKTACDLAFEPVSILRMKLENKGLGPIKMVIGGSPTFPIHSKRANIETSPGTTLLWDERYSTILKDMYFLTSSVLITRIISKPGSDLLCFDLGHKSIAPEMSFPRLKILGLEDCPQITQSEEHLVVKCNDGNKHQIGDVFYAIPMHICPTVAKYQSVSTVEDHKIRGSWKVVARNQKLTI